MKLLAPGRLAAVILGVFAVVFGGASWKLGYWVQGLPGPGMLPFATSVLLLPAVFFLLRSRPTDEEERALSARSLSGIALCAGCGIAMPWLGMVIPSALLATLWMRIYGRRGWLVALLIAALMVGALALLFVFALRVPVPLWPALA